MIEGKQRNVFFALLVIAVIFSLASSLKPLIVGYTVLKVGEERSEADDKKPELETLTQLEAYVGEEFRYMVRATDEDDRHLVFSDDSDMFDMREDGLIEFLPTAEVVGDHYVTLIVKDKFGKADVKIVPFVIRQR